MVTTEPDVAKDGRYNVTATAKALGIARATLRKYDRLGYISHGIRRGTYDTFYTGAEIRRFWKATISL